MPGRTGHTTELLQLGKAEVSHRGICHLCKPGEQQRMSLPLQVRNKVQPRSTHGSKPQFSH